MSRTPGGAVAKRQEVVLQPLTVFVEVGLFLAILNKSIKFERLVKKKTKKGFRLQKTITTEEISQDQSP